MKYCPNPDCSGLQESQVISEFNDTAKVCADCGAPLVTGPAPDTLPSARPDPEPDLVLVPVLTATREADIVMIESLLGDAGIRYLARGERIQDLFGLGRLVGINPITGPVEFTVAAADEEDARRILADFLVEGPSDGA
jgi:hypothetical protein